MTYETIKLMIGIPTCGKWESDFGISLVNASLGVWSDEGLEMLKRCGVIADGGDIKLLTMVSKGSILPSQRSDIARRAIQKGCTHLLFADDDMTFPMHTIIGLLARDLDIVGANCATKAIPPLPTGRKGEKEDEIVFTRYDSKGVEEVTRLGTGIMLIKTEVFEKLGEPWFAIPYDNEKKGYIGEDVFFCRKAMEAGYKLYVDHDLSKQVGHVGQLDYCHQLMPEYNYGERDDGNEDIAAETALERRENDKKFVKETIDNAVMNKKAWEKASA